MLPNIPIISENISNKSCSKKISPQKKQWVHMSISPRSGAKWFERLPCFKYYNVREQDERNKKGIHGG